MPSGLRHTVGESFDVMTSEVIEWLVQQPELRNYLFEKVRMAGAIEFDVATGTWAGAENVRQTAKPAPEVQP